MKVPEVIALPQKIEDEQSRVKLLQIVKKSLQDLGIKVNAMCGGRVSALDNSSTVAPTVGSWAQGDEVVNSNPTELGSAGSKYVIDRWKCVASGTPGTWVQCRYLTGN